MKAPGKREDCFKTEKGRGRREGEREGEKEKGRGREEGKEKKKNMTKYRRNSMTKTLLSFFKISITFQVLFIWGEAERG